MLPQHEQPKSHPFQLPVFEHMLIHITCQSTILMQEQVIQPTVPGIARQAHTTIGDGYAWCLCPIAVVQMALSVSRSGPFAPPRAARRVFKTSCIDSLNSIMSE